MTQKAADHPTTRPRRVNDTLTLGTLGSDLLDTAWRIAIPVLIFALLGIFADKNLETAPWITLIGVVIGFVIAGLLIKKQLATLEQRENKS
jgi:hypothetical protein